MSFDTDATGNSEVAWLLALFKNFTLIKLLYQQVKRRNGKKRQIYN